MRELVTRLRLRMYGMTTGADVHLYSLFSATFSSVCSAAACASRRSAAARRAAAYYVVSSTTSALLYVLCKSRVQLSS